MEPVWVTGNRKDERKFFCPIRELNFVLYFIAPVNLLFLNFLGLGGDAGSTISIQNHQKTQNLDSYNWVDY